MRLFGALFVLVTISLTVACTKREAIEKARQLQNMGDLSGTYENAEVQKAAAASNLEQLGYSNFEIKNERLVFRRLNPTTGDVESEVLGELKAGTGVTKTLIPAPAPSEGERPSKQYSDIFQNSSEVRLTKGTDGAIALTATPKTGQAKSIRLVRVDEKASSDKMAQMSKLVTGFLHKKKEILAAIEGKELLLVHRVKTTIPAKGDKTEEIKKAEDLKDEEVLQDQNVLVNFKKIKITSRDGHILVNGKHTGAIGFFQQKQADPKAEAKIVVNFRLDEGVGPKVLKTGPAGVVDLSQANLVIVVDSQKGKDSTVEMKSTYSLGAVTNPPVDQKNQPVQTQPEVKKDKPEAAAAPVTGQGEVAPPKLEIAD